MHDQIDLEEARRRVGPIGKRTNGNLGAQEGARLGRSASFATTLTVLGERTIDGGRTRPDQAIAHIRRGNDPSLPCEESDGFGEERSEALRADVAVDLRDGTQRGNHIRRVHREATSSAAAPPPGSSRAPDCRLAVKPDHRRELIQRSATSDSDSPCRTADAPPIPARLHSSSSSGPLLLRQANLRGTDPPLGNPFNEAMRGLDLAKPHD
jgi:hypothetical protein